MTDLDRAIRQALSAEDAEFLAKFESESPLHAQLLGTFTGRYRWLNVFALVLTLVFVVACFYCGWQLFNAVETRDLILWASGLMVTALFVAMLKMWFWMELHKNHVLRELKRLELQVARLAARA